MTDKTKEAPALSALKLALEALTSIDWVNSFNDGDYLTCNFKSVESAIAALREALALVNEVDQEWPAQQQEPVAVALQFRSDGRLCLSTVFDTMAEAQEYASQCSSETIAVPLYTSPPAQRTWIGLTDEEMHDLEKQFNAERVRTSDEEYLAIYPSDYWAWQRAIEAKLKEKNHG